MNTVIADQLNAWLDEHRGQLTEDIIALTNIKSVAVQEQGPYPFGEGCAQALDHMLKYAERLGFPVKNESYYYGYCTLPGTTGKKTIGIFSHLDVVPEGTGWSSDPYNAFLNKDDYIVGRGSSDNKGPVIAAFYALKFLKEQQFPLKNNVSLVFGCAEEIGMYDMDYFLSHTPVPDFSLVPDCPFPVCYGEKGRGQLVFSAPIDTSTLISFHSGESAGSISDHAEAVLAVKDSSSVGDTLGRFPGISVAIGENSGQVRITAKGIGKHAATPDGCVDACFLLAHALADSGLLAGVNQNTLAALAAFSSDHYGGGLHIACRDDASGSLTCACSMARIADGRLQVTCDIRHPVSAQWEDISATATAVLNTFGFQIDKATHSGGGVHISPDEPVVSCLTELANEVLGTNFVPYIMSGGTYARKLPHAVGFGPGRPDIVKPFPAGKGWGHQPDEGVRVQSMVDMVRVYVQAILTLDQMMEEGVL